MILFAFGFWFLVGLYLGMIIHGLMVKDYAENHKAYTINGVVYYIVKESK